MNLLITSTAKQTAIQQEAADSLRLKKADEAIEYFRQQEADAIRELNSVRESLRRAREKRNELFQQNEERAGQRRRAGLIEISSCY